MLQVGFFVILIIEAILIATSRCQGSSLIQLKIFACLFDVTGLIFCFISFLHFCMIYASIVDFEKRPIIRSTPGCWCRLVRKPVPPYNRYCIAYIRSQQARKQRTVTGVTARAEVSEGTRSQRLLENVDETAAKVDNNHSEDIKTNLMTSL